MMQKLVERVTEMMKPHLVYLVGGAVRDYVMGNEPKDYDFCTPAEPDEIEEKIREYKNKHGDQRKVYGVGKKFGTLGCKIEEQMVEITTFRTEEYEPGNRKPNVKYVKSINEDLSRRDFTINAMAMRIINGKIKIIDPFNGRNDIKNHCIRAVGNARQRFKEDPLRMLRACRFASRYNFEIFSDTDKRMKSGAIRILDISKERWVMELDKILMSDYVEKGLYELWENKLFTYIIPEIQMQLDYNQNSNYHNFYLDEHTTKVVAATPKDINLRWAALLHDIAKPFVRTENKKGHSNYIGHEKLGADMVLRIAGHLKWSNERTKSVVELIKNHLNDDCPLRKYDNIGKKETANVQEVKDGSK